MSSAFSNEYKTIMQTLSQTICIVANTTNDFEQIVTSPDSTNNIYHLFLRYLYLNLRENTFHSNSSFNNSSGNQSGPNTHNTNTNTNTVWRTFKGRLYTRKYKLINKKSLNLIIVVIFIAYINHVFFSYANACHHISNSVY